MSAPWSLAEQNKKKKQMADYLQKHLDTGIKKYLVKAEALRLMINYYEKKADASP